MAVSVTGGALEFEATVQLGQFDAALRRIESRLGSLTQSAEKETTAITNIAKQATLALSAYASFSAGTNFIREVVNIRGEFQKLEVSFRTMLKSRDAANKLLQESVQLAATTPFSLRDVATGAKQLLAYGFQAQSVTENLRMLGDVASGVGAPLGDIVYLYGTLRTQGRAYTRDIMQFTARGIPIIDELAKVLGVATDQVQGLVEAGSVGFPEVEKAFQNLTGSGGLFFNLMAEQSRTLSGQISNLQDSWEQMLNTIGQANEGLFNDAIKLASTLVKNYEKIIDALKILVIVYGSYRAALLATAAAQYVQERAAVQSALAGTKLVGVQKLMTVSTIALQGALQSIGAAAAASAPVLAIAALGTIVYSFAQATSKAEQVATSLNKVMQEGTDKATAERTELGLLQKALQDNTNSESRKAEVVKKLRDRMGEYAKGLSDQEILLGKAGPAIEAYIKHVENMTRAEAALTEVKSLQQQIAALDATGIDNIGTFDRLRESVAAFVGAGDFSKVSWWDQMIYGSAQDEAIVNKKKGQLGAAVKELQDKWGKQMQDLLSGELGKDDGKNSDAKTKQQIRSVEFLDKEIKRLKELRDQNTLSRKDYDAYTNTIKAFEAEKRRITGESDKATEDSLNKRKEFLKDLADLERESFRNGLPEEKKALKEIEDKYDELIKKAKELGLGAGVVQRINNLKSADTVNKQAEFATETYKKTLNDQIDIFAQYEETKKKLGKANADAMFKDQTKGFSDVFSFLEDEAAKLFANRFDPIDAKKLEALGELFVQAQKKQQKEQLDNQNEIFADILQRTETFNIQRNKINERYEKEKKILEKSSDPDKEERLRALKAQKDAELDEVQRNADQQATVYKLLADDIQTYSRKKLQEYLEKLKTQLQIGSATLPPAVKEALQSQIKQLEELLKRTSSAGQASQAFGDAAEKVGQISGAFHDLAGAVQDVNADFADTLDTLGDLSGVLSDVFDAASSFAKGDAVGGVVKTVKAVVGVFQIAAKARATERQAKEEIAAFQDQIYVGEADVNALYRERERSQVRINKLRLDGIDAETELLKRQQETVQDQFNTVLRELQKEQAIVGKTTERYGGVLGIGRKTRAVDVFQSLEGKSFDELNELFIKGQLTGKAKELFEILKKLNDEQGDIAQKLADTLEEGREIFTGSSRDAILDSIVDGFKGGLRSASDFADNFEELMRNAVINSIKFKALEAPLGKFFEDFAASAETDGVLTQSEIEQLRANYNRIIDEAGKKFDELQKITGVDLTDEIQSKSLKGTIKGITEQQADLLAGQFGGLRITALEHVRIASQQLGALNAIESHTSYIRSVDKKLGEIQLYGIKITA